MPAPNTNPPLHPGPLLPSLLQVGAGQPTSDIHSAHMLKSDRFVKYQCICCSGDAPKHHAPTLHSLFTLLSFLCNSSKKSPPSPPPPPIHDVVLLLRQSTFRAPLSIKGGSGGTGFSLRCKTACFGWNTLPTLCSGTVQPRDWSGDGICCFFFFPLF